MEDKLKDIKDVRDQIQVLRIEQDRLYEDLIERIDIPHEALENAIEDYYNSNPTDCIMYLFSLLRKDYRYSREL